MPSDSPIRLAYSPDSDDAFMFWALREGKVDAGGFTFVHSRDDTEALNRGAEATDAPDVCAISIHQYAYLADDYLLLPHGGSVGAGYGPVLVANRPIDASTLKGKRIGVPGLRTTAYLVLRLILDDFEPVIIGVSPFSRAFDAVRDGEVDAVLMIHEGRLMYEDEGFSLVLEIGEAWKAMTYLPLPLGGNVIKRSLGQERIRAISNVLRESIRWGLDNREELITALLAEETRAGVPRDREMFDRYLSMYANQDTLDYGPDGRRAVVELLQMGTEAGIIPHEVQVDFAP